MSHCSQSGSTSGPVAAPFMHSPGLGERIHPAKSNFPRTWWPVPDSWGPKVPLVLLVVIFRPRAHCHLRASRRFVGFFFFFFQLNARCLKLLPGCLAWLTHKLVSRLKTACSDLLLSPLWRWQQSTDPHFLPGERWQLFEKRIPIERCNPAPPPARLLPGSTGATVRRYVDLRPGQTV